MGRGRVDPDSPAGEDRRIESAVMALLLDEYPDRLTLGELRRVLHPEDPEGAKPFDAVERAVCELIGAGLLHRHGQFVMPSRAALYFERLEAN
jgi:hypothetical protein